MHVRVVSTVWTHFTRKQLLCEVPSFWLRPNAISTPTSDCWFRVTSFFHPQTRFPSCLCLHSHTTLNWWQCPLRRTWLYFTNGYWEVFSPRKRWFFGFFPLLKPPTQTFINSLKLSLSLSGIRVRCPRWKRSASTSRFAQLLNPDGSTACQTGCDQSYSLGVCILSPCHVTWLNMRGIIYKSFILGFVFVLMMVARRYRPWPEVSVSDPALSMAFRCMW